MKACPQSFHSRLAAWMLRTERADDEAALQADGFLKVLAGDSPPKDLDPLFAASLPLLEAEYAAARRDGRGEALDILEDLLDRNPGDEELAGALWKALFPEAFHLDADPEKQVGLLRSLRTVTVVSPVRDPITEPAGEILFSANVLLSPPAPGMNGASDALSGIIEGARRAGQTPQEYWYDHPVAVGTAPEADEVLHGLKGLSQGLAYEKTRGTVSEHERLTVILSISVTHTALRRWARPWLQAQLSAADPEELTGLDVYAFTEEDAARIVEILEPRRPSSDLKESFGVDGNYGRHYSFLKALPALWSLIVDPAVKATFKIDLDQVFPQNELTAETGLSAMEHFQTPLWGAEARDNEGRSIELGMIAGALVNEKDIAGGLFTPDVPWPLDVPEGDDLIFFKQRPMAVSTRAEMMTRFDREDDASALQRIHVTGGTNGIRLDALRRHRPFTPSFVERAEDQAYILSVFLDPRHEKGLRYLHEPGLIMRHDKEAFAGASVRAGKTGAYVGDLLRLFVFSTYAGLLPGGPEAIKKETDPFTGCFITPMPATLALLRLALRLRSPQGGSSETRKELLTLASRRLYPWIRDNMAQRRHLETVWKKERLAWNAYYDALDALEAALAADDEAALETKNSLRTLIDETRVLGEPHAAADS